MKSFDLKKLVAVSALAVVAVLGTSEIANAQNDRRNDDRRYDRQEDRKDAKRQERIRQQNARIEQERIAAEQKRQAELNRRHRRNASGNDRSNGNGYYNGNANANTNRDDRYRVRRNGAYYNTDRRGAEMLRQAVQAGYRQGFQAGRNDRNSRRQSSWTNQSDYRSGTYGYESHVDRSQYQYYFRQGFQRGYQDGSNSRYQDNYQGQYQYGSNNGGSVNILSAILGQILNIQPY